jgi:hypothetical protein
VQDKELVKLRRSIVGKVRAKDVSHLPEEELYALLQNDIYTTSEMAVMAGFFKDKDASYKQWCEVTAGMDKPIQKMFFTDLALKVMPVILKLSESSTFDGDFDEYMIAQSANGVNAQDISKIIEEFMLANTSYHMQQLVDRYQRLNLVIKFSDAIDDIARREPMPNVIESTIGSIRHLSRCDVKMITPSVEVVTPQTEKLLGDVEDDEVYKLKRFEHLGNLAYFTRKEMHAIGAPPSNGKTAFAMQLIDEFIEDNPSLNVSAFLLESDWRQYQQRYTARKYGVNLNRFIDRRFTIDDRRFVQQAANDLMQFDNRLFMQPRGRYSATDIGRVIRQQADSTGIKPDVIIVDHIGRVQPEQGTPRGFGSQEDSLLRLQEIAEENNAILIVMSQLDKDSVTNSFDKKKQTLPTITAFKYGTITEISKLCIILFKDSQELLSNEMVLNQKIVVVKANNGSSGYVDSLFVKPLAYHIEAHEPEQLFRHRDMLRKFNFHV